MVKLSISTLVCNEWGNYLSGMKHQSNRYRVINGVRLMNYCDLIYDDVENEKVIAECKAKYKIVRKIKHPDGFYQLFTSEKTK